MEEKLGRKLNDSEIVHHINGIRDDNRIENLSLMSPSTHCATHNKSRTWAEESKKKSSDNAKRYHRDNNGKFINLIN